VSSKSHREKNQDSYSLQMLNVPTRQHHLILPGTWLNQDLTKRSSDFPRPLATCETHQILTGDILASESSFD